MVWEVLLELGMCQSSCDRGHELFQSAIRGPRTTGFEKVATRFFCNIHGMAWHREIIQGA